MVQWWQVAAAQVYLSVFSPLTCPHSNIRSRCSGEQSHPGSRELVSTPEQWLAATPSQTPGFLPWNTTVEKHTPVQQCTLCCRSELSASSRKQSCSGTRRATLHLCIPTTNTFLRVRWCREACIANLVRLQTTFMRTLIACYGRG